LVKLTRTKMVPTFWATLYESVRLSSFGLK